MASQLAIKQLGTNGGGFFNANSAHPFENPTPLTNFLQLVAILLIPAALCYTFGRMVGNTRQGWVVLAVMMIILVGMIAAGLPLRAAGRAPGGGSWGWTSSAAGGATTAQPGGNMEGKEVRFGIADSAAWAVATTGASNGSVNSMHDSFTPLGGLVPLVMIQLGEVVFGGVGSGLYVMLVFAIVAVFIAGLMVGRTPEYLGKKIETYEMKMASLIILIPVIAILVGTMIGGGDRGGPVRRRQPGRPRLQRDPLCLHLGGGQQRQRLRRPVGQHHLLQHRAGHLHARSAASGSSCPRWPWPARWPRRSTSPRARARCAPTARCSSACSSWS